MFGISISNIGTLFFLAISDLIARLSLGVVQYPSINADTSLDLFSAWWMILASGEQHENLSMIGQSQRQTGVC
jgi:hypothetical protein